MDVRGFDSLSGRAIFDMKNPEKLLRLAAKISRLKVDVRTYCLGAVAIRSDDVVVTAYNGSSEIPNPLAHCEARLVRKLDFGATVFLARTTANGEWANSKPCPNCQRALARKRVRKLYYTSGPNQWETLSF